MITTSYDMLYCVIFYCYDIWMIHHYGSYKYDMISLHGLCDTSTTKYQHCMVWCDVSMYNVITTGYKYMNSAWCDLCMVRCDISDTWYMNQLCQSPWYRRQQMMWYVSSKGNSYHIMLTWYHTDMSHIVSHPITSSHLIPPHHTALHITSHHPIPSHNEIIPSHHITSSHPIPPHHTALHITSHHRIPSHHIPHHITSSHPIS